MAGVSNALVLVPQLILAMQTTHSLKRCSVEALEHHRVSASETK